MIADAVRILGILESHYVFNAVDNITAWGDGLDAGRSQSFEYGPQERLLEAGGPYGTLDYSYDPVGNRLTRNDSLIAETYLYDTDSNRLNEIQGGMGNLFAYDAAGNMVVVADGSLDYDDSNRLTSYTALGISASYAYNGHGEHVRKAVVFPSTISSVIG